MSTLLQPLMLLEEGVLEGLHALGLAWGLAIVGLTLLVRLALVPLALRAATNPRAALGAVAVQLLVVISLALLLRDDAAAGTFGDAGWLFIDDLSEPAAGAVLAGLLAVWIALQVGSFGLSRRRNPRRVAIAVLAPLPLLFAATQIPAGILLYLLVSTAFGVAQKAALRSQRQTPAVAAV
jgi:membrane protein insertase Oxa1/YidC/SpoIIIJ